MVYQDMNQLRSYYYSDNRFLTTSRHFMGGDQSGPTAKKLAFATQAMTSDLNKKKKSGALTGKSQLDLTRPEPGQGVGGAASRVKPSATYGGGGTFVVELPHSFITYRNLNIKPSRGMGKSEYQTSYQASFSGYRPGVKYVSKRW